MQLERNFKVDQVVKDIIEHGILNLRLHSPNIPAIITIVRLATML